MIATVIIPTYQERGNIERIIREEMDRAGALEKHALALSGPDLSSQRGDP